MSGRAGDPTEGLPSYPYALLYERPGADPIRIAVQDVLRHSDEGPFVHGRPAVRISVHGVVDVPPPAPLSAADLAKLRPKARQYALGHIRLNGIKVPLTVNDEIRDPPGGPFAPTPSPEPPPLPPTEAPPPARVEESYGDSIVRGAQGIET